MFKFFRDASSELEHVVWPTRNETNKYMAYNVVVIIVVTVFLMVLGYLIQSGLVAIRSQFDHELPMIDTTVSDTTIQTEPDQTIKTLDQNSDINNPATVIDPIMNLSGEMPQ